MTLVKGFTQWRWYLATRRELPYWWKGGCFVTILRIFPHETKDIIFTWRGAREVRLNPRKVRLKWTSETEGEGRSPEHQKTHISIHTTLVGYPIQQRGVPPSSSWGDELDLHKSGNELSLDLHMSGNEWSLDDLHRSGNELIN